MKIKKKIIALFVTCLTIANLFAMPVMAAEGTTPLVQNVEGRAIVAPAGYSYAGTFYRSPSTISLGRVTLIGNTKLYLFFPKNDNLDLGQGTVTFRSGLNVVTKNVANLGTDTWVFDASDLPASTGMWSISVSAYAIGTTSKMEMWYKVE